MFIILSFKLDTQSWNVHNVPSPWTYWPLKPLTWFYFTIMICYILNHVPNKSIIVLAHLHTHTARNSSSLLYWPPHCFSYFFSFILTCCLYIYIQFFSISTLPSPIFSTRNSDFRYLVFWGMCTYVQCSVLSLIDPLTLVLYFHSPAAHKNTAAHSCNIQPYYLFTHQIILLKQKCCICNTCRFKFMQVLQ